MREKDIITRLSILKTVQPSENWVAKSRERILSQTAVYSEAHGAKPYNIFDKYASLGFNLLLEAKNSISDTRNRVSDSKRARFNLENLFPNKLAVSLLSAVFVLFTGFFIVDASKSSIPGDPLYSVKIASEDAVLAVAPEAEKPKIEIEQAGNRLEELAKISQKLSDVKQQAKAEELVANFEKKISKADERLTKLSNNDVKEKVAAAKVINVQSEKYGEALAKVAENLPSAVKEKVSDKVAKAIVSTEKVNMNSLLIIVETEKDAETMAKVKAKIDKAEQGVKLLEEKSVEPPKDVEIKGNKNSFVDNASIESNINPEAANNKADNAGNLPNSIEKKANTAEGKNESCAAPSASPDVSSGSANLEGGAKTAESAAAPSSEAAKKEIEKAREDLENNNLVGALKGAVAAEAITEKAKLEFEIMPVPVDASKNVAGNGAEL